MQNKHPMYYIYYGVLMVSNFKKNLFQMFKYLPMDHIDTNMVHYRPCPNRQLAMKHQTDEHHLIFQEKYIFMTHYFRLFAIKLLDIST